MKIQLTKYAALVQEMIQANPLWTAAAADENDLKI